MPLGICEEVEVPEGVEVRIANGVVEVSGPRGKLVRMLGTPGIAIKFERGKVLIQTPFSRRRYLAMVGTIKAHLLNMFKGVTKGFIYKLRTVYSHFPITVEVEDKHVLIRNFLGEKTPRVAKIIGDVKVEVKGDEIIVEGINREEVGQTAFNIEQATLIKRRDPRVFQNGCYIVSRE